jgi:Ser/Thr protein kinase RdoA (MazF antagonist)
MPKLLPATLEDAKHALSHWDIGTDTHIEAISIGNLNATFKTYSLDHPSYILQRLNPIFSPSVNEDIFAVTNHLAQKGLLTPKLIPTRDHNLSVVIDEACWRLQTFIEGSCYSQLNGSIQAHSVGEFVGRFHLALEDLNYSYHFTRSGVHNTQRHVERLKLALDAHKDHRLFTQVAPLAYELLKDAEQLPDFSKLPLKHSHGDLKINNVLFSPSQEAICVIDLDTLGLLTRPFEMGDALRSWCNPAGEDATETYVDIDLFEAALQGYGEIARPLWSKEEVEFLLPGYQTIILELAARFLADALNESYFGYDRSRFPASGEHNLLRGEGQWNLYLDAKGNKHNLMKVVDRSFS